MEMPDDPSVGFIKIETEIEEEGCLNVWLMPWCDAGEVIDFGQIKVWNYFKKPPQFKIAGNFKEIMPLVARSFRNRSGNPKDSLYVISDTRSESATRNDRSRWAAKAIAFSYISGIVESFILGHLNSLPFTCSERFMSQQVAVVYGKVYEHSSYCQSMTNLDGESVKFFEPYKLPPTEGYANRATLEALAKVNDGYPYKLEKQKRRLWHLFETVFDWFSNAWTVNPGTNQQTRLISLMVAFEALTREEQDTSKIYKLVKNAAKLAGWNNELPKKLEDKFNNNVKMVTEPEKWILEYGEMRNRLAHGGYVPTGHWMYETPVGLLDPRTAMTIVVNELVLKVLLDMDFFDDITAVQVRITLRKIKERLGWTSSEVLVASPSLTKINAIGDPREWKYWPEISGSEPV
ncbi:MAG: hypothetical protein LCH63_21475 [Candidatus Melainabacteria bacterium]|nr:hypothetical protein [Candidatus Melainabacteria bacterium]